MLENTNIKNIKLDDDLENLLSDKNVEKLKEKYDLDLLGTFFKELYENQITSYYKECTKDDNQDYSESVDLTTGTGNKLFESNVVCESSGNTDVTKKWNELKESKQSFINKVDKMKWNYKGENIYLNSKKVKTPIIYKSFEKLEDCPNLNKFLNHLSLNPITAEPNDIFPSDFDFDPITSEMMKCDWNNKSNCHNLENIEPILVSIDLETIENKKDISNKFHNKKNQKEQLVNIEELGNEIKNHQIEKLLRNVIEKINLKSPNLKLSDLEKKKRLKILENIIRDNTLNKQSKEVILTKLKGLLVKNNFENIIINYYDSLDTEVETKKSSKVNKEVNIG